VGYPVITQSTFTTWVGGGYPELPTHQGYFPSGYSPRGNNLRWVDDSGYPPPNQAVSVYKTSGG
jgi:hypothetical protein